MHLTADAADSARPISFTCMYDAGAMYDCAPLCSAPATHRLMHKVPCYGWYAVDLCQRHVKPMQGRVYPDENIVRELVQQ